MRWRTTFDARIGSLAIKLEAGSGVLIARGHGNSFYVIFSTFKLKRYTYLKFEWEFSDDYSGAERNTIPLQNYSIFQCFLILYK